ncbi:MAG: efflux RND transporter permease subunit [Isosphaeraceae bacterium]
MLSRFFIDRPIGAWVVFFLIIILGLVALTQLPVSQYPVVTPPTISVSAVYPGADARTVAETVATPIETEVNGVEKMLYMSSQCTNDGQMNLTVTFELGTDLDMAQVLVQNRVAIAQAKLPEDVRRQGVTTKKKSPAILLCINLISPDESRDLLYLSNYATLFVKDTIARIPGVGDINMLGARDYSMRVWLDPDKLASRSMTAGDITRALREQNVQVAAGRLGQPPAPPGEAFQLTLRAKGRLIEPGEFDDIVVKTGQDGAITRLRDVGRAELGAKNYEIGSYLDGKESITLAVFQLPGSNAVDTARQIREAMGRMQKQFPPGVDYKIVYDTTLFVEESIFDVVKTLFEAFILVVIVVLVFLQDWKATILPMLEVPVSLIGTFIVMWGMGFSLNNLSLFGLVLAIGIVVDDAIVVIENVERWMATGLAAREATIKAMDEVTGPVLAISFVLAAVFVPVALMKGISGQFYSQFALTIAFSAMISALNALTMTPARCVLIFGGASGHAHDGHKKEALPRWGIALLIGLLVAHFAWPLLKPMVGLETAHEASEGGSILSKIGDGRDWLGWSLVVLAAAVPGWIVAPLPARLLDLFLKGFNKAFDLATAIYGRIVGGLIRVSALVLLAYGGLLFSTYLGFVSVPVGFVPEQDKGYLVGNAQLPDGASLERTEAVIRGMTAIVSKTPGVAHTLALPGYSILTSSNQSNSGGMFIILEPFESRKGQPEKAAPAILTRLLGVFFGRVPRDQLPEPLRPSYDAIQDAQVVAFGAPPVEGVGSTGGFKLQVEDRGGVGLENLELAVSEMIDAGNQQEGLRGLFSSFRAKQPQVYIDIDRAQAKSSGVSLADLFETLQTYLGSAYVNDFTYQNRNWQVNVQADQGFRDRLDDVRKLQVRNAEGKMVPIGALLNIRDVTGPAIVNHYNLYPSAEINGNTKPGFSTGQAIALMDQIAEKQLPVGMASEWTELIFQQLAAEKDLLTKLALPLSVVMVFLVLSFQYESWGLPLAVILIVPMCLMCAIWGTAYRGMDNNIFTQIGLVVLIALACKNAILIVEFAREKQDKDGMPAREAAVEASKLRLRPILMTSFAFILGVVPLVTAQGAGFEMRRALGTAVFYGMLGVTIFGVLFTPVFYVVIRWFGDRRGPAAPSGHPAEHQAGVAAAKPE